MARNKEARLTEIKKQMTRTEAFIERLKTKLERQADLAQRLENELNRMTRPTGEVQSNGQPE